MFLAIDLFEESELELCRQESRRRYGVMTARLGEVMFADVWLPGDQHGSPVPGATRPMTPENR